MLKSERIRRLGMLPTDRRERKCEGDEAPEDAQAHAEVLRSPEAGQNIRAAMVDVRLDRSGEAQSGTDAVVDDGDDKTGRNSLVLLAHAVAQDDGRGRVAHVHAKRHDEDREERVAPVDLLHGCRGHEEAADKESHHGYELH